MDTRMGERGHSLAEMLVAMSLTALLMAATLGMLQSGLAASAWGTRRVEAQQAVRVALDRMARELREAGYDPASAGIAALVVTEPTRVVLQRDLDGDGVIDTTRERVTYLLRPGESTLRRDAGAGAQPIADGVRRLAFSYFDRDGAVATDPATVAAVSIELEAGRDVPAALMSAHVMLRNAPFW